MKNALQIQPLPTYYNGLKFRSRLEARWAIFFDCLKIHYFYELNGYDLGNHGWYLPDFFLSTQNTFVEIKPFINERELEAMHEKFKTASLKLQAHFLLLIGAPEYRSHKAIMYYYDEERHETGYFSGKLTAITKNEKEVINLLHDGFNGKFLLCVFGLPPEKESILYFNQSAAFHIANTSRFEHGETPTFQQIQDRMLLFKTQTTCKWPSHVFE